MTENMAEQWQLAVSTVSTEFSALPAHLRQQVAELTHDIRLLKEEMGRLSTSANVAENCLECAGECCRFGRHHFSVVDLLGYLTVGEPLFTPDFAAPVCPYIGADGCFMAAAFRPLNCVIFLCEPIHDRLTEDVRRSLEKSEQSLRQKYRELERILNNRFANGLLITFERATAGGNSRILNVKHPGAV